MITELRGHTLLVTIDRPEARNAIDQDTWDGLGDAWHRAETVEAELGDLLDRPDPDRSSRMTHLAIVTGASRGIGRAMARRLASDGIAVAAVSRTLHPGDGSLAGSLEETVQIITAEGGTARHFVADLGRPELDRAALVAEIEDAFGERVDILVNNAAAARHHGASFLDIDREMFHDSVETNVWNTWDLMKAVVPSMRARGAGWIVNLSSRLAGPRVGPPYDPHPLLGSVLYGATKAAIDRLTTGAAMELYDDRIAVNTLAPTGAWRPRTPRGRCPAGPRSPRRRWPRPTCCCAPPTLARSPAGSPTPSA